MEGLFLILLIVGIIGWKVYQNINSITEALTVVDIDMAGISDKAGGISVGITRHIAVGGGKTKKAGKAVVAFKDEQGNVEEYKVKAKYLMRSEIRVGDVCEVKHYKKKILDLKVNRAARYSN